MTSTPRTLISQGLLYEAKQPLQHIDKQLIGVKKDDFIVGIEPSETLVWRDEAAALIGQEKPVLLYEELMLALSALNVLPNFKSLKRTVKVHLHCHQKSLAKSHQAVQALSLIPDLKVELLNTGCYGMSGDFGYKHYEISKKIAETSFIPQMQVEHDELTVATGTSYRHQLNGFSGTKGLHPAQVF